MEDMKVRKEDVAQVSCPRCSVPAGKPCMGTRNVRRSFHVERWDKVRNTDAWIERMTEPLRNHA